MLHKKLIIAALIFLLSSLYITALAQEDTGFYWDKELVRKVVINDKEIINKLLIDLSIIEADVNKIEIFDVDKNGPSEGDLLKVYPSENVYSIKMLSAEVQDTMNKWPYTENIEKRGKTVNIRKAETAEEKILYVLAYAINALYSHDKPLKLYFEQKESGIYTYELLGYNPKELKQDSDVLLGDDKQQKIMDLFKAFYKEMTEGPPTLIHVVETERDTIRVPEEK